MPASTITRGDALRPLRAGAHHHHIGVRIAAARDEGLGAVQPLALVGAFRPGAQRGRVRARSRFGQAIGKDLFHRAKCGQPARLRPRCGRNGRSCRRTCCGSTGTTATAGQAMASASKTSVASSRVRPEPPYVLARHRSRQVQGPRALARDAFGIVPCRLPMRGRRGRCAPAPKAWAMSKMACCSSLSAKSIGALPADAGIEQLFSFQLLQEFCKPEPRLCAGTGAGSESPPSACRSAELFRPEGPNRPTSVICAATAREIASRLCHGRFRRARSPFPGIKGERIVAEVWRCAVQQGCGWRWR